MRIAKLSIQNLLEPSTKLDEEIAGLKKQIAEMNKPFVFRNNIAENAVYEFEKAFYMTCAGLKESGFSHPEQMTMHEFRLNLEYLEKKARRLAEVSKNR